MDKRQGQARGSPLEPAEGTNPAHSLTVPLKDLVQALTSGIVGKRLVLLSVTKFVIFSDRSDRKLTQRDLRQFRELTCRLENLAPQSRHSRDPVPGL